MEACELSCAFGFAWKMSEWFFHLMDSSKDVRFTQVRKLW